MLHKESLSSPVVLLVEDDVLLRLVTADSLRASGFDVIEAANSAEAMRVLECIPVDAMFSDIHMPGRMNGLALAKWVHQRRLDTRIVLTSGVEKAIDDTYAYATFLPKPYEGAEVEHLLRSVLPSPMAQHSSRV